MGSCEWHHARFSRPGKPTDNAYAESFNATSGSSVSATTGSWIWTTSAKRLKNGAPNTTK